MKKTILSILMAMCLVVTGPARPVYAAEVPAGTIPEEVIVDPVEEAVEPAEEADDPVGEAVEPAEEIVVPVEEEQTLALTQPEMKLNYLYLDYDSVDENEAQNIVVSVGDENVELLSAVLTLVDQNGEIYEVASSAVVENAALFTSSFPNRGTYQVTSCNWETEAGEGIIRFEDLDMEPASFDVGLTVEEEFVKTVDPELYAGMVTFDAEGNLSSSYSIEDAIINAGQDVEVEQSMDRAKSSVVVVIDAGHDSSHRGASGNGLKEEELTLKIAKYCKEELEKYAGVKVYMTRTGSGCPTACSNATDCNKERVNYAKSVGADVYVAIHLNTSVSASAKGAEVYYPNENYKAEIGEEGEALAAKIQKQLVALGLFDRDIKIRNSEDGTLYPDDSLSDYYGIIRNSKLAGFPGVIVEHAFLTNTSDVSSFLSSDSGLKKLGAADAKGIANYFGLGKFDVSYNSLTGKNLDKVEGTFEVSVSGLAPADKIKGVEMDVSAGGTKQLTYTASGSNGAYTAIIDMAKHGLINGEYTIEAYAITAEGDRLKIGETSYTAQSMTIGNTSSHYAVKWSKDRSQFTLSVGQFTLKNERAVRGTIWKTEQGSGSGVSAYYTKHANGAWYKTYNVSELKGNGDYTIAVNVFPEGTGASTRIGNVTVRVGANTGTTVTAVAADESMAVLTAKDMDFLTAISKVYFNVRFAGGEAKAYEAAYDEGEKVWKAEVSLSEYKKAGTYYVETAAVLTDGSTMAGKSAEFTVAGPEYSKAEIVDVDRVSGKFTVRVSGVNAAAGIEKITANIWQGSDSTKAKTYDMTDAGNGTYTFAGSTKDFGDVSGNYQAQLTITDKNGVERKTSSVSASIQLTKMHITAAVDSAQKSLILYARELDTKKTVSKVYFNVWSTAGGTDDLKTYSSVLIKSTGAWKGTADVSMLTGGEYKVQGYMQFTDGKKELIGETTFKISRPEMYITAGVNSGQTTLTLYGRNVVNQAEDVVFEVWESTADQDNAKEYKAVYIKSTGAWKGSADISKYAAGTYKVNGYAVMKDGDRIFVGEASFTIKGAGTSEEPDTPVTPENPETPNKPDTPEESKTEYYITAWTDTAQKTLTLYGRKAEVLGNVKSVSFTYWNENDGENSKKTCNAVLIKSTGAWKGTADVTALSNGTYQVRGYAKLSNGTSKQLGSASFKINRKETTVPPATDTYITSAVNSSNTIATLYGRNVGAPSKISKVQFTIWNKDQGKTSAKTYDAVYIKSTGAWKGTANISSYIGGDYQVQGYAYKSNGSKVLIGESSFKVNKPKPYITAAVSSNKTDLILYGRNVASLGNVSKVTFSIWSEQNGKDDMKTYTSVLIKSTGAWKATLKTNTFTDKGTYQVSGTAVLKNGTKVNIGTATFEIGFTSIMGKSETTVKQMVAYYKANAEYPSYYKDTEASTIEKFCQIYYNEAEKENVRAEVAFCQAMKETGWLKFGGDVDISQFNFAGIGATGGGVPGLSFESVTIGIRAQIQHLKAYASKEALNSECVDPRYEYVSKGCAPFVEWLGQKEHPEGKGWATGANYGYDIARRMNNLLNY